MDGKTNGGELPAAGDSSGAELRGRGLMCRRGGRLLFRNLGFTLAAGDAMLVVGRNGAGKSSLLRLMAGLLPPTRGTLENPFATALLAADLALKPEQTVGAELQFWGRLDGASTEALAEAATQMAVAPLLEFRCRTLSSGQRQRVAIARTIASGAKLWLLDEPTNALDTAGQEKLLDAIARHRANGGLVVAATHQPLPLAAAQMLEIG